MVEGGRLEGKGPHALHLGAIKAVDAGVGLRLDITVFVIRFDVGFPLRKPWEQNPWVANQINLGDAGWRRNNLVYNLAIGYPF